MALVVQKYGGSSVENAAAIKRVAARIASYVKAGHQVAVVVSAMGDTTDELIDLATEVNPKPPARELDMLLTAGERISMAVLSMALNANGVSARAYTGSQAGVITDDSHGKAQIIDVTPGRIVSALNDGHVAIVAGFQGVSSTTKEITTLGRGGSDTTAVALAAALKADVCEIYSDVDGVYTADPRIVPTARKIVQISPNEMLEMAAGGAKILMLRCVEYARRFNIPIHVRSSFSDKVGTVISADKLKNFPLEPHIWRFEPGENESAKPAKINDNPSPATKEPLMKWNSKAHEAPLISGVAHDASEGKLTLVDVPDTPGKAAEVFEIVARAGANIDMIVQNVSTANKTVAISFTLPETDSEATIAALKAHQAQIGFTDLLYTDQIGKVSLIGAGMKHAPGVSATLFRSLADAGINIDMISTSEIRISVVTEAARLHDAVRAIHTAFGLDSEDEAVVYAGSGR